MSDALTKLSNSDLASLIAALRSNRLAEPYPVLQVSRVVPRSFVESIHHALTTFENSGFSSRQIATALELILADRSGSQAVEPQIDLVTSGPEAPGITNRDTSVVVRELFAHANQTVLVIGYSVFQGQKVFQTLAQRMEQLPTMRVQFFLNISRPDGDTTTPDILVARFKKRFKEKQWPAGSRFPELYYDPRSVDIGAPIRSSLHAKCVVVDSQHVFVSSANFTEAGHERNIEVGLRIDSELLATRISTHFRHLYDHGLAARAF